jgi:hypothetical protein
MPDDKLLRKLPRSKSNSSLIQLLQFVSDTRETQILGISRLHLTQILPILASRALHLQLRWWWLVPQTNFTSKWAVAVGDSFPLQFRFPFPHSNNSYECIAYILM